MTFLVDTSVWSLAFRRDTPSEQPEVQALREALVGGEPVAATGLILTELLRGFVPKRAQAVIREQFAYVELIEPARADYEAAAELANTCRSHGVQLGTVDALIAQLAVSRELTLLTTDGDFAHAAAFIPLRLWGQR
ncbi:type II toxin-antitoxin system VapC family toxin [Gryllotalpicola koreensis]|uniref:Ribonuclease VapC n=1 Tax=Gryllotalpicola koreensis TaxID=993086 RepID=A0ABP7ZU10_9MICO